MPTTPLSLGAHPEIEVVVAGADLPGEMSGLELCRRVSERRPDVQLVLTAAGEGPLATDMPNGARVLHKLYASGELRTLVAAKSLRRRRLIQAAPAFGSNHPVVRSFSA